VTQYNPEGGPVFLKREKKERERSDRGLPTPDPIPDPVGTYLVTELKMDPDYVWKLKAAVRPWPNNKKICHFRVFDERVIEKHGWKVEDYFSLDAHSEQILFQGVLDRSFFKVVMKEEYNRAIYGDVR
jgi:hypothetical protein